MNQLAAASSAQDLPLNFDLLRTRLETSIAKPGVVVITSATTDDGAEAVARGLGTSLAAAPYQTLCINCVRGLRYLSQPDGARLEDVARRLADEKRTAAMSTLSLVDPAFQRAAQRDTQAALEILGTRFEYVVINAEASVETSFGASVIALADAVLVTIKKGRRQKAVDGRLASELHRPDVRFLGVIAVGPEDLKSALHGSAFPDASVEARGGKPLIIDKLYAGK